ncbi:hypothetical protein N8749_00135 [bacterium]|nr:hypothetical protein [bacterium]MDA9901183.1 hypothetical protein [Gammaproteobacteria bacterium]
MYKLRKSMGVGLITCVCLILALNLLMRFSDGPLEIISGGPFTTGELIPTPSSWTSIRDRNTIEFQTLDPISSRTVWLAVHDEKLFIISGYMNTFYGGIWKQWPHYLNKDDRIIIRVDGRLSEHRLKRVLNGPDVGPVLNEFSRKYGNGLASDGSAVSNGDSWLYEVVAR